MVNQLTLFPQLEKQLPYKYLPGFLDQKEADQLLEDCRRLDWKQYSNNYASNPRLECLYGVGRYSYGSGILEALPWTEELKELNSKVIFETGYVFNSVFCNRYRDGNDSIGWHADRDLVMGENPAIASVSLGQMRSFEIKDLRTGEKQQIWLEHGSLLLMLPGMQASHHHRVPKALRGYCGERINLTFRPIGQQYSN